VEALVEAVGDAPARRINAVVYAIKSLIGMLGDTIAKRRSSAWRLRIGARTSRCRNGRVTAAA
jgi:hypothetical protein